MADQKAMAAQIAALGNQIKQLHAAKKAKPSHVAKSNKKGRTKAKKERNLDAPAATLTRAPQLGMGDLMAHRIAWLCGFTYVGDGTLGVIDSVYFRPASGASGVAGAFGDSQAVVPILSSDTVVGQTYLRDIEKYYARKRVRTTKLHLVPFNTSTANSAQIFVAPIRGPGSAGDTVVSATPLSLTVANTLGMNGVKNAACWSQVAVDLTPYIAGGSGAKQNEFAVSRTGDDVSTAWGAGAMDLTNICPCSFSIAGNNSTAALRGTNVHYVIVEQVIDLLDFLGGNSLARPLAFTEISLQSMLSKSGLPISDQAASIHFEALKRSSAAFVEAQAFTKL